MTAPDAELAANVTNELVKAYLEDQAATNSQTSETSSPWLRERIETIGPNARIITDAVVPDRTDPPSAPTILVAAIAGGLLFGLGLALAREVFDNSIRTRSEAAALTCAECFG